ncbi:MAG: hypothetical protein HKP45_00930 [Winogradskyella sp.]|nr:hypothetical protein [Winogradskyella sp.]
MKRSLIFMMSLIVALFTFSCSTDDDNNVPQGPQATGNVKTYTLNSVADPSISGTATFIEFNDNSVTVELNIQNTPAGGVHPAHIHVNTAAEGGDIAVSLNSVDGNTGESSTNFSALDDGTAITYNQLLDFDGYINVHLSAQELSTIVAQGDIGQNELTGQTKTYTLEEKDVAGINGTAEFAERVNGTTLVTIALVGTPENGSHPAHIHENDAVTSGPIIVGLNPVDGATGISKTQVSELVGGASVTYDDLLTIDAYINVHLSIDELATIVAQGNIGSNEGTPTTTVNYNVTNSGAAAYIFNDGGFTDASNPDLTLQRGVTYTFTINAPGHPFYINATQGTGTGNAYNNGVTNNGEVNGVVTFTVPNDAPNTLFYNCQFHGTMTGTITIVD